MRITRTLLLPFLLAAGLLLPAATAAAPAHAAGVPSICNTSYTCGNFWNGGFGLFTYIQPGVANDNLRIVSIGGGLVQIDDGVHGGCVGDLNNQPNVNVAGGGIGCPLSGSAGWGTKFQPITGSCANIGTGWFMLKNVHWGQYLGFASGNDHPVTFTNGQYCVAQITG